MSSDNNTTETMTYAKASEMIRNKKELGKLKSEDAVNLHKIMNTIQRAFQSYDDTIEDKQEEYDIASLQGKNPDDLTGDEKQRLQAFNKEMRKLSTKEEEVELPCKLALSTLEKYHRNGDETVVKDEDASGDQPFVSFDVIDTFGPIIDFDS